MKLTVNQLRRIIKETVLQEMAAPALLRSKIVPIVDQYETMRRAGTDQAKARAWLDRRVDDLAEELYIDRSTIAAALAVPLEGANSRLRNLRR